MKPVWVQTTLGEIAEIVSGATPSTSVKEYWDGDIRWVTPKDLSDLDGSEISHTARSISAAGLRSCAASVLPANSVLLSSRAPIGLVAINRVPMATNQGFKSLVPDPRRVDSRFLYWWLKKHRPLLESLGNGATFKEISKKSTAAVPISLPPIEEQRRIAAILDAADALRTKRRHALEKLDTLTQSIFIDMFGDPFHPGSKTVPLCDMAEILMGQSPPGSSYNNKATGTPLLNGPSEFGAVRPTAVQWTTSPTRLSVEGDILFCVRGATAGRMNWSDGQYCLGRGLAAIRSAAAKRPFIYSVLSAYYPRFQALGVGSTFINISKKDLHQLPMPDADAEVVARYGEIHGRMQALNELAKTDLEWLDALFSSLQHRAFRGEL